MVNHTFGYVRRNADGTKRPHQGWDFEAADGTPCFAISDGEIEKVTEFGGYGKQVILRFTFDHDHDGDRDTLFAHYAHLSRFDVKPGDKVKAGQQIGLTGSSGNAVSMSGVDKHLHFEIRTMPLAGRGLANRYSPMIVFGHCPLEKAV
jgi:murein DD-endopeptidase MepM/ murein hydrolase activator NlpD